MRTSPLGAALPLLLLVSCGAWRSPAGVPRSSITTTPLCCCWMESSSTSPSPIYSGGFGAAIYMRTSLSWRSPTPHPPRLLRCLAKPCWSTTVLHHHHAVVLLLDGVFLNLSLSPCWIKAWETSPGCTCVERGGAVRSALGSPVIWITTSTTPSSAFLQCFRIAIYNGM